MKLAFDDDLFRDQILVGVLRDGNVTIAEQQRECAAGVQVFPRDVPLRTAV